MAAVEFPVEALGCGQLSPLVLGVPSLLFSRRSSVCFQAGERLPAHCAMVAMARDFEDRIAVVADLWLATFFRFRANCDFRGWRAGFGREI
jgi:hypothetical protein